eukprot:COSAG04_NODE_815_length_10088_cov_12.515667_14_plen_69_part_00
MKVRDLLYLILACALAWAVWGSTAPEGAWQAVIALILVIAGIRHIAEGDYTLVYAVLAYALVVAYLKA